MSDSNSYLALYSLFSSRNHTAQITASSLVDNKAVTMGTLIQQLSFTDLTGDIHRHCGK